MKARHPPHHLIDEDAPFLLIVDDEPGILEAYRNYLCPDVKQSSLITSSRRKAGSSSQGPLTHAVPYNIVFAGSGEDAVALVQQYHQDEKRFAGGFFDVKMPGGIDGVETIKRVHQIDPQVVCTIVTAYQDRSIDDINQQLQGDFAGEWVYVHKPFSSTEIRQRARSMVSQWQRRNVQQRRETKVLDQVKEERALSHRESLASLGRIAASVAHEINNPCTYILTELDACKATLEAAHELVTALEGDNTLTLEAIREKCRSLDLATRNTQTSLTGVQTCIDGVWRIAEIVRDLKQYSKPTVAHQPVYDVSREVERTLRLMRNQLEHHATVCVRLEQVSPVNMNVGRLSQVLSNLVRNAAQAMPARNPPDANRIDIEVSEADGTVWLSVADNGCGMDEAALAQVFEPFYTTKDEDGTGLGLPVVKELVEQHGGTVDIQSKLEQGTRVRVGLPASSESDLTASEGANAAAAHASGLESGAAAGVPAAEPGLDTGPIDWQQPPQATKPAQQQPGQKDPKATSPTAAAPSTAAPASAQAASKGANKEASRSRLLLVDDDARVLSAQRRLLSLRYDVTTALGAVEAMESLASDSNYDAVVCDLMMPGMRGDEFYGWLETEHPKLADNFLIMTGGAFTDETQNFLDAHKLPTLAKPFRLEELVEHLGQVVAN